MNEFASGAASGSASVYDFMDYKKYLDAVLSTSGKQRGLRSKLATELRCQTSFVSRVIHGPADFSPDHAVLISAFLGHTEQEKDYFILLVQLARSGTRELREHYLKHLRKIQEKREQVRERIQVSQELTRETQMTYYSAWYYSAIHVLTTVPRFQRPAEIARQLDLPLALVSECLEFLASAGIVVQQGARYRAGTARVHLGPDSPMLPRHHGNWKMRAMRSLDLRSSEDLFFSGPISLSEADAAAIRSVLLKTLENLEPTIRASEEEAVFCLGVDFFRVTRRE